MDLKKIKIDILRCAGDWTDWKINVILILRCKDVYDAVLPTYSTLAPVTPAKGDNADYEKQKKEYERKDYMAQLIIRTAIDRPLLPMFSECTTAAQMWQKLHSRFEQRSGQRLDLLYTKLFSYTKDPNHDVATHCDLIMSMGREISDELGNMTKNDIIETVVVNRILNTLPEEFQEFKDSLSVEDKKLSNLYECLCLKELSINRRFDNSVEALHTKTSASNRRQGDRKPPSASKGNIDDQVKHTKSRYKGPKCYGCNKFGHIAKDCPDERVRQKSAMYKLQKAKSKTDEDSSCNITECTVSEVNLSYNDINTKDAWLLDSGASRHLCNKLEWFSTLEPLSSPGMVRVGNAQIIHAVGCGSIKFRSRLKDKWSTRSLENVWYVPKLSRNLISVGVLTNEGYKCNFIGNSCAMVRANKKLFTATKKDNMYIVQVEVVPPFNKIEVNLSESVQLQIWHERLAHQNKSHVMKFLNIEGMNYEKGDEFCEGCIYGKQHRGSYKTRPVKATQVGELVSSDLCGPIQVPSLTGKRYLLLFKDEYSKFRVYFCIKEKSEVVEKTRAFLAFAKTHGHVIKSILTDGGKEYDNRDFKKLLDENGITFRKTAPYTPQQNGSAERENRTIIEASRAMIHAKNLPPKLWAEAVNTAVYVLNRTGPTPIVNKTPYELWYGKRIPVDHLRIFGTTCYVHVPKQKRRKLDKKSQKGILVGYHGERDGYRVYIDNEVVISKDVVFQGESPVPESFIRLSDITPVVDDQTIDDESDLELKTKDKVECETEHDTGRILRDRLKLKKPVCYGYSVSEDCDSEVNFVEVNVASIEPYNYEEAIESEDVTHWKQAMEEEINSLKENKVWELVDLPKARKLIKSRWVFKVKIKADGTIDRYKARLVAKGYSQKPGIDYKETFSPVARYDTIRSILSVAAVENLKMRQFDVKTAFLYGDLLEEIFMEQPEGFDDGSGRVCQLKKSLYGLKQAPRCWNIKFTNVLREYGLTKSDTDSCLFTGVHGGHKIMVVFYVDDGLIVSTSNGLISEFLNDLKRNFQITTSEVSSFLGMNVMRHNNGSITISQTGYVKNVLQKFNMSLAKPVSTPIDKSCLTDINRKDGAPRTEAPYREAIGCLMYLSLTTRPDIAFAVNFWAKRVESPTDSDWTGVKRVFRYLVGTQGYGLTYEIGLNKLEVFSDADFASSFDRKSTSGVLIKYGGAAISWTSKKQTIVAQSTMEAELIASNEAAKHILWFCRLFGTLTNYDGIPLIQIDNQSTIKVILNDELYRSTKHVEVKYLFVRDVVQNGQIKVGYVSTQDQAADGLTKPLDRQRHNFISKLLGMECMNN